jgi:hypothetical protein
VKNMTFKCRCNGCDCDTKRKLFNIICDYGNTLMSTDWYILKYLRTILTNQNDIHDDNKSRLNSGNACFIQSKIFFLPF